MIVKASGVYATVLTAGFLNGFQDIRWLCRKTRSCKELVGLKQGMVEKKICSCYFTTWKIASKQFEVNNCRLVINNTVR